MFSLDNVNKPKDTGDGIRLIKVGGKKEKFNSLPNGHWKFDRRMQPYEYEGFLYIIENKISGKFYIGKKFYLRKGKLAGTESDWKNYNSSNKKLLEDINTFGLQNFEFYVLEEYKTRGTLSFGETWSLCIVEAPMNRDKFLNVMIENVSWVCREKLTEMHKLRLKRITEGDGDQLPVYDDGSELPNSTAHLFVPSL